MKPIAKSIFKSLGIILMGIPFPGNAQPYVDILNFKYHLYSTPAASENHTGNIKGSAEEAAILLPMETKNKNVVLAGFNYSALNFTSDIAGNRIPTLYSASLQMGYDQQLKNSAWRRTILLLPKLNGDMKGAGKSFQAGGVLMFTYKKKENLKYHFGLYYNREFFGDYYIPLVGIDWKINSRFYVFGDLPNNLSVEMEVFPGMRFGTGFNSTIASYRIHSQDKVSYIREGDNFLGHDQVKIYFNYYITKNIVVFGEAGRTINRKYVAYDANNNILLSEGIPAKDGIFLTGGLAYRFTIE